MVPRVLRMMLIAWVALVPFSAGHQHTVVHALEQGVECSDSVHDSYTVVGPDGNRYPTWHPPVDSSGCYFDHEHGDDPRQSRANSSLPAFGYIGRLAGDLEPHNGFKVFVVNSGRRNDENRTMRVDSRMVFHMGTGGPARFDTDRHSLQYDMVAQDGHFVHVQGMADTGSLASACNRNTERVRLVVLDPSAGCDVSSPYEIWTGSLDVGGKATVIFSTAVFDPVTVMDPSDHSRVVYADDTLPHPPYRGCKRESYHGPVYWYNRFGPTTFTTDPYGGLLQGGPLRQEVSQHIDIGIPFSSDQQQFKMPSNHCNPRLGLLN